MSKLKYFATAILSAGVGFLAGVYLSKDHFKKLADEEIEEVRDVYAKLSERPCDPDGTNDVEVEVEAEVLEHDPMKYVSNNHVDYTSYSEHKSNILNNAESMHCRIIPPEEYGEDDNYTTESLTYFADGYLTDDDYQTVYDPDECIGESALTHFGEYEDDSVFVRNETLQIDYEVLLDMRNYKDVVNGMPAFPGRDAMYERTGQ